MSASTSTPETIRRAWPLAALAVGALIGACELAVLSEPTATQPDPVEPTVAQALAAPVPQGAGWSAVVLGPARGHLEPCGCSGGQLGGIDRLTSVLASAARGATGQATRVAAGGVVGIEAAPHDPWARAQLESIWEAYAMLGLEAVGLASSDLVLGKDLRSRALLLGGTTTLLASNLVWIEAAPAEAEDAPPAALPEFHQRVHRDAGGVAYLSIMTGGLSHFEEGFSWGTEEPTAALQDLITRAEVDPAASNVVLFEGDAAGAEPLAAMLGPSSMILLVTDEYEPTRASDLRGPEGGARVANLGSRLRSVLRLDGGDGPPAYDVRLVTEDVPGDASMDMYRGLYRMLLSAYDARSSVADSLGAPIWEGYVGSEACAGCHQEAYEIWQESLHHQGMETLNYDVREGISATVDPRCIKCHAVGFGYETGYGSQEVELDRRWAELEGLAGIGCENCHGPGALHSRTEQASDIDLSSEATCYQCHDSENDPYFSFEEDWPLISHDEPWRKAEEAPADD